MFEFNRTQGCYLEHVSITARLTHPLLEGVRIQQSREPDTSDPHWPNLSSSLMTVRDTIFNGQGAMGTAIRVHCVDPTPGHVIKNDFHRFERLQISACLHAGLVLEGRNAKQLSLRDVVIQGRIGPENATGLDYGVLTVANASPTTMEKTNGDVTPGSLGDPAINDGRPVYNHGAAFSWISGAGMATRIANVYIGDRNDTLLLKAIYCEKGSRWLVVPDYDDGAVGAFPIQLESLRYTVNDNGSALVKLGPGAVMAADGPAARIYPRSVAQWKVAGLPWPSSQWDFSHVAPAPPWVPTTRVFRGDYAVNGERVYKCAAQGITAASGGPTGEGTDIVDGTALWDHYGQGTGVIRDLISSRDLLIVGTIESGQSRPGFDRERFIQLTHGSSESLQLRSTAYDPADGAVAVLFDFEVTQSAGTQTIVQLGNRTRHPAGADCWCG